MLYLPYYVLYTLFMLSFFLFHLLRHDVSLCLFYFYFLFFLFYLPSTIFLLSLILYAFYMLVIIEKR
jgi:hypothetical protein